MSSMQMSQQCFITLADFLASHATFHPRAKYITSPILGHQGHSPSIDFNQEKMAKIFSQLQRIQTSSLSKQYGVVCNSEGDFSKKEVMNNTKRVTIMQAYKLLGCILYQIETTNNDEDKKLLENMHTVECLFAKFFVSELKEYNDAKWGDVREW